LYGRDEGSGTSSSHIPISIGRRDRGACPDGEAPCGRRREVDRLSTLYNVACELAARDEAWCLRRDGAVGRTGARSDLPTNGSRNGVWPRKRLIGEPMDNRAITGSRDGNLATLTTTANGNASRGSLSGKRIDKRAMSWANRGGFHVPARARTGAISAGGRGYRSPLLCKIPSWRASRGWRALPWGVLCGWETRLASQADLEDRRRAETTRRGLALPASREEKLAAHRGR